MGKKKKLVLRNIPVTLIMTVPFLLFFTSWWFFHTWSTMTVNELVFNRGKYINTVYMPRLRILNAQDLDFLRKIQKNAAL